MEGLNLNKTQPTPSDVQNVIARMNAAIREVGKLLISKGFTYEQAEEIWRALKR